MTAPKPQRGSGCLLLAPQPGLFSRTRVLDRTCRFGNEGRAVSLTIADATWRRAIIAVGSFGAACRPRWRTSRSQTPPTARQDPILALSIACGGGLASADPPRLARTVCAHQRCPSRLELLRAARRREEERVDRGNRDPRGYLSGARGFAWSATKRASWTSCCSKTATVPPRTALRRRSFRSRSNPVSQFTSPSWKSRCTDPRCLGWRSPWKSTHSAWWPVRWGVHELDRNAVGWDTEWTPGARRAPEGRRVHPAR